MIIAKGATIKGDKRPSNQDALYINDSDKVWIVADGMGGHAGGETASKEVCEHLPKLLKEASSASEALHKLHSSIVNIGISKAALYGLGATVVIAKQIQNQLNIYWVGDCRAYHLKPSSIVPLTKDHSHVQQLIDLGLIDEAEARSHPKRNIVTQCIGGNKFDNPQIGLTTLDLGSSQYVLLCSDGLYSELGEQEMLHIIEQADNQEDAIQNLLRAANANGGNDNITAILLANKPQKEPA